MARLSEVPDILFLHPGDPEIGLSASPPGCLCALAKALRVSIHPAHRRQTAPDQFLMRHTQSSQVRFLMFALAEDGVGASIQTNINNIIPPRARVDCRPNRKFFSPAAGPMEQRKTKKIPSGPNEVNPIAHSINSLERGCRNQPPANRSNRGCRSGREAIELSTRCAFVHTGRTSRVSTGQGTAHRTSPESDAPV